MNAKSTAQPNMRRTTAADFPDAPPTLVLTASPLGDPTRLKLAETIGQAMQAIAGKSDKGWREAARAEVQGIFWQAARGLTTAEETLKPASVPANVAQSCIPVATHSLTTIPLCGNIHPVPDVSPIQDPTFKDNSYVLYDLATVAPGNGIFRHYRTKPRRGGNGVIFRTVLMRFSPTSESPSRWQIKTLTRHLGTRKKS